MRIDVAASLSLSSPAPATALLQVAVAAPLTEQLTVISGGIALQPEEDISLSVMNKKPGLDQRMQLQPIEMSLSWGQNDKSAKPPRRRIAYERLLLDALSGDSTLFVRRDEVEAQWQWIDGVRAAWDETGATPQDYVSGSWGPTSALALTKTNGVEWHD